ncbi:lysylphosphatidylglycerol synthase domain-containing protein [Noviherbaspirillum massiliense]|uniref:lysylphosphatidylglycerol synthase domain-containing protein n=1 Tax=Noviherbaspirillum massiliense TaxID=1465823 RepID=UPI0002DE37A8|nr:lysylphosphatidylglycerol synthase domain-containing protein [Noviherbaspirillum massiliense]
MKRLAYLSGLAGLLLLIILVVREGWPEMLAAFRRAGWPLLLLLPAHLVPLVFDTQAWRVLLEPVDPKRIAGFPFLLWVAAIREAVNRLLPVANIGGEIVGVRLGLLRMSDTNAVTATVIVEVLVTIVVQYLFCGLGIVLMMHIAAGMNQVWTIAAGLLLSLPLPVLIYLLLRHGAVFERLEAWADRLLGEYNRFSLGLDGVKLDADIHRLFADPWRLIRALAWQLAGYLVSTFETWFALTLLGHPVSLSTALAIEALTQATRHAVFIVPAGLGIQEAAVMLFGHLAGVGSDVSLSLALIKRAREILFGVPVLLWWQWVEARQLRKSKSPPDTGISDSA